MLPMLWGKLDSAYIHQRHYHDNDTELLSWPESGSLKCGSRYALSIVQTLMKIGSSRSVEKQGWQR